MKKPAPCLWEDADGPCGQSRNGPRHYGHDADHDYLGEPKAGFGQQRATLRPRSERPNRVQRYQESQQGMQAHREAVRYCEGPSYGLSTPCGRGPDGTLEQSHTIVRGMGGGRDYGILATLCRKHHREVDEDRATARAAGLSIRAPVPDKVVPRRGSSWDARPLFDQDEED